MSTLSPSFNLNSPCVGLNIWIGALCLFLPPGLFGAPIGPQAEKHLTNHTRASDTNQQWGTTSSGQDKWEGVGSTKEKWRVVRKRSQPTATKNFAVC